MGEGKVAGGGRWRPVAAGVAGVKRWWHGELILLSSVIVDFVIGRILACYQIVEKIGEGGPRLTENTYMDESLLPVADELSRLPRIPDPNEPTSAPIPLRATAPPPSTALPNPGACGIRMLAMANAQTVTVLDHIDRIEVPGDVFAEPVNEYWALLCLRRGLFFLAAQVARIDEAVKQRVNPDGKLKIFIGGNDPAFSGVPMGQLTCAFHWYAVSACQYVKIVGAIAYRQGSSRPLPPKYVEAVIPEVLAFRDKVAAHYAWATQHERDNEAERVASILPAISFDDDCLCVSSWTVAMRSGGKSSDSSALAPWSIAKIHRRLCERYWHEDLREETATVRVCLSAKDIYDEGGSHYRFILGWRQRLLAGYVAILVILAIAFKGVFGIDWKLSFVVPGVAGVISFLFWLLDVRNRQVYRQCQNVCAHLEKRDGFSGIHRTIEWGADPKNKGSELSHSRVLTWVYLGTGVCLCNAAFFLMVLSLLFFLARFGLIGR